MKREHTIDNRIAVYQQFLGRMLEQDQEVLSLLGPSGTGKTFSASFLQEYLGYKMAPQVTTRAKRPDDEGGHYQFISKDEFIKLEQEGKILGLFAGDRETQQGNGYGYRIEEVLDFISTERKIILFPSAFELTMTNFRSLYGTTPKIGLGFKNAESVRVRAEQCGKVLSREAIDNRVRCSIELTNLMEQYLLSGDERFKLIFSDILSDDLNKSKILQLSEILTGIGKTPDAYQKEMQDYVERER